MLRWFSHQMTQGRLAQLGERLPYKQDVGGSSPSSPTIVLKCRHLIVSAFALSLTARTASILAPFTGRTAFVCGLSVDVALRSPSSPTIVLKCRHLIVSAFALVGVHVLHLAFSLNKTVPRIKNPLMLLCL